MLHDAMPRHEPDLAGETVHLHFVAPKSLQEEIERQVENGAAKSKSRWLRDACYAKIGRERLDDDIVLVP